MTVRDSRSSSWCLKGHCRYPGLWCGCRTGTQPGIEKWPRKPRNWDCSPSVTGAGTAAASLEAPSRHRSLRFCAPPKGWALRCRYNRRQCTGCRVEGWGGGKFLGKQQPVLQGDRAPCSSVCTWTHRDSKIFLFLVACVLSVFGLFFYRGL